MNKNIDIDHNHIEHVECVCMHGDVVLPMKKKFETANFALCYRILKINFVLYWGVRHALKFQSSIYLLIN